MNSTRQRVHQLRHPERQRAREALHRAVARGDVVRASACVWCGASKFIEAHHTDYKRPLRVKWLCRGCHQIADAFRRGKVDADLLKRYIRHQRKARERLSNDAAALEKIGYGTD